jgi:hypothetical protein
MPDLRAALRDHVDAAAPPIDLADVLAARPRRTRPVLMAVAAVALAVLGVGAVLTRASREPERVVSVPLATTAGAMRDGTGADLLWARNGGFTLADPETGERRDIAGPEVRCGTCGIVRVGETLFAGGDDGIYRLDPPSVGARRITDGNVVFPAVEPDELFVATASRAAPHGAQVRRVSTLGAPLGGPWSVPDGYWLTDPPRATSAGVVVESPPNRFEKTLKIWDPSTGEVTTTLGRGTRVIDSTDGDVAWVRACGAEACTLALTDVASGRTRDVAAPVGDVGFVGGGAFSPDGSKLAAFSMTGAGATGGDAGGRRMRLVVVDVRTARAAPVARSVREFGESYGYATWSPDGRWVFFGGLDRSGVHRVGSRDAVALAHIPSEYSAVALASVHPPTTGADGHLADGRHFGFLKAVDEQRHTLSFDLAEHFTGEAANRAAAEDGAIEEGEGVPNDYYIRNVNPRVRELPYAPDVTVHPDRSCTSDSEVCGYLADDMPSLLNRLRNPDAPFAAVGNVLVWLTVVEGRVVDIENPYVP